VRAIRRVYRGWAQKSPWRSRTTRFRQKGRAKDEGGLLGRVKQVENCRMAKRGARGDNQWGKNVKTSSSQGQVNRTIATRAAWMVGSRFKYLYTDAEKKETMEIEEVVRIQRHNTTKEVIVKKVKPWLDDPYYSRTHETKYFKLAKTYGIVKEMVA
jgi:hypothetical protein